MQPVNTPQLQLSPAGYAFINSPTRTPEGSPDTEFWITVTEIYVRIHGRINDMKQDSDMYAWFDQIFVDSFTEIDLEPDGNHPYRYRQRWRRAITQMLCIEGSQAGSNAFLTGGRVRINHDGRTRGDWRPYTVVPAQANALAQRTAEYVIELNDDEEPAVHLPPRFPNSNLPLDGETMLRRSNSPEGWIYILTHPLYSGWVKIGKTRRLAQRLSSYNVGTPNTENHYVIERHFPENIIPHPNALGIEQELHRLQDPDREPGQSREWYPWSVEEAVDQIQDMLEYCGEIQFAALDEQAQQFLDEEE